MKTFLRSFGPTLSLLGAAVSVNALVVATAHAQDYTNINATGSIRGTDGNSIPGAAIEITSEDQGFSRAVTADGAGNYRITQIPAGRYTFKISASGYEDLAVSNVALTPDRSGNQFVLALVGGTEIIVTAGRVEVSDFQRTTVGAVVNVGDLADRVPVARDLTSIVKLSPGTTQGDTAFGNLPNIAGGSVAENQFFVNGLSITDLMRGLGGAQVPFEFYETVEVKNGGYQAEFGCSTGGVVNAVTKSGSNKIHAGIVTSYNDQSMASLAPDTFLRERKHDTNYNIDANVYLSGPIIKDRLFVYALYNFKDSRQGTATTARSNAGAISGSNYQIRKDDSPFWGVKLDGYVTDDQHLEFTYFDNTGQTSFDDYGYDSYRDATPDTSGRRAFKGRTVTSYGGENYIGRYTGKFTDWLTISAAYGRNKDRDIQGSSNDDLPNITDLRGGIFPLGNTQAIVRSDKKTREFYRADVDLFFNLFGEHHIRAGYDRESNEVVAAERRTGGQTYNYYRAIAGDPFAPAGTDYVETIRQNKLGTFKARNEAFYIQDSWSLFDNRVNLQFGVRNDRMSNTNGVGRTFFASGNSWAPRLGFTADPFGDERTKVYGSFGRYYFPVATNTSVRLAGGELFVKEYHVLNGLNPDSTPIIGAPLLFAGADLCPGTSVRNCDVAGDGTPNDERSLVSKNIRPQTVDEYILGAERRFGEHWRVGLFYTYRKLVKGLEDAAIDAAVIKYCQAQNIVGCDAIWDGFHQYVVLNPGAAATITLSDTIGGDAPGTLRTVEFSAADLAIPKAKRNYHALTFQFDREFDGVWGLSGSYTLSSLKGNLEGGVRSDNGQNDTGWTTMFDQPGLSVGADGYLPGHRKHNLKLYGSYKLTDWLTLGANYSLVSPRKFGCIGRVPNSVDSFAGDYGAAGFFCNVENGQVVTTGGTRTLTPRASQFESDWDSSLDMSFLFTVPTDALDASFRLDLINVLNAKGALDFEERGTLNNGQGRTSYRLPTAYQAPRSVRLQFAIRY